MPSIFTKKKEKAATIAESSRKIIEELSIIFASFFRFEFKFMKTQTNKKAALLAAFDQSEKKQTAEVCRIAGVAHSTFYFHYYKDADFRRQVLEKQLEHLTERVEAESSTNGIRRQETN